MRLLEEDAGLHEAPHELCGLWQEVEESAHPAPEDAGGDGQQSVVELRISQRLRVPDLDAHPAPGARHLEPPGLHELHQESPGHDEVEVVVEPEPAGGRVQHREDRVAGEGGLGTGTDRGVACLGLLQNAASCAGHDQLVARLRSVLLGDSIPDERTALLISLLAAGGKLRHLVPQKSSREALRLADGILERFGEGERVLVAEVGAAVSRANSSD